MTNETQILPGLVIDTTDWVSIYCDKCGTSSKYDPEFAKTVQQCFGCMPESPPK